MHPRFVAQPARAEQRRLLGVLLAAPLFVSASAWTLLPASVGVMATFGFFCMSFCVSAVFATMTALTGRTVAILPLAGFAVAAQIAVLIASAGGLQSPITLMLAAVPLELLLVRPTQRTFAWSVLAVASALVLQALVGAASFSGAAASAWHWMVPLAYCLLAAPRVAGRIGSLANLDAEDPVATEQDDARLSLRFAANGDLIEAGEDARAMLGVDGGLLLGPGLFERIHVADRVVFLCALADMRDSAAPRKVELRIRIPSSPGDHVVSNYRPVAISLKRSTRETSIIEGCLRDNLEIAELRTALASALAANEQADFAKGRFLAAVSHELRTPLNSIIGFSDMMLCEIHGGFANPQQKEHVAIIREAGNHLLAVVNSVLDVSKIESGCYATSPEPFRFHEAVNLCVALMRMQAEAKGVTIATNVGSSLGEINADRRAVQQMLINLMSNAVKFTPSGGKVRIEAERVGTRLHFSVADNGIGISEGDMDRIGQPFAQVQNDYTRDFEGTGLGLALVKGLVVLHDGTMSIDSALGMGTKVEITLPINGPAFENAGAGVLRQVGASQNGEANGTLRKAG